MPPEAPSSAPAKSTGMVSLYANLLEPSGPSHESSSTAAASISRAPVVFKPSSEGDGRDENATKKPQINPAALRFQPTKRPQAPGQKSKPKPALTRNAPANTTTSIPPPGAGAAQPARAPVKSSLADWTTAGDDDDVNDFYAGEKRQRGGRKKRKKNKDEVYVPQDWDDIYDPSRPNNYEEYKHSDERIREIRDWKDRLYAHRLARRRMSEDSDLDPEADERKMKAFAPPSSYSFGPPPDFDQPPPPGPPSAVSQLPNDNNGEDAYARRMRLSLEQNASSMPQQYPPPPPPVQTIASPPPPPPTKAALPQATISKAPVRYNLPPAPTEIPTTEAELEAAMNEEETTENQPEATSEEGQPRSLRPGQKGFAQRMMAKYGWTKGSGLGATGSGIINPLRVQVEKQKKRPDSEGGGFVGPGGRGKIVGGKKKGGDEEGKFGAMSEVIVLRGMVDGMDLDAEMETAQGGGLMQEIGEECSEKYGRVERVYIDRTADVAKVFVRFTSQLSALRAISLPLPWKYTDMYLGQKAVNALEGRVFNGNAIGARFFDADRFERGEYGS